MHREHTLTFRYWSIIVFAKGIAIGSGPKERGSSMAAFLAFLLEALSVALLSFVAAVAGAFGTHFAGHVLASNPQLNPSLQNWL